MSFAYSISQGILLDLEQFSSPSSIFEEARNLFEGINEAFDRVQGAIEEKWVELGDVRSFLGYPTTDERKARDKVGRYNHFQGGSIDLLQISASALS